MRVTYFLIALSVGVSRAALADSPASARRDKALQGIEACLRRNWVPSRECKNFNKDIETLAEVYRQGDKSVLPTLLQFAYLTDFLGEALINDPDAFLTAVSQLPEQNQQKVATRLAGRMFGVTRARFDAIRATLMQVADSSPNYQLARLCLSTLETENASYLVNYFPPQTFTGRFQVHWFSRELYALGEKPLWPPISDTDRAYRITVLPAFLPPESVALTVMPDGSGQIEFRTTDSQRYRLDSRSTRSIDPQQVADFTAALNLIQFWQLPTECPQRGVAIMGGTEWILEGVQDGKYQIVVRTCPGTMPFGEAAQKLFDLSGHKSRGGC